MTDAANQRIAPAAMGRSRDGSDSLALRLFGKLVESSERWNTRMSLVPNTPVLDPSFFPWIRKLESRWLEMRSELESVLDRREELPSFQDLCPEVANIQTDDRWKTYLLYGYGIRARKNCERCPRTAELVREIPGMKTAFFSILSPGKHIPAHRGPYNGVLRYHLGLIVPEAEEQCRIRIDRGVHHWREGKSLVFDDSFNHEVWNDTPEIRVVLFVDFLRPVRMPARALQKAIIGMARWTPFIKASKDRYERWEERFYADEPAAGPASSARACRLSSPEAP